MRIILPTLTSQKNAFSQNFHNLNYIYGMNGIVSGSVSVDKGLDVSGGGYVIFGSYGADIVWNLPYWSIFIEAVVPAAGSARTLLSCGHSGTDKFELGIDSSNHMQLIGASTVVSDDVLTAGSHSLLYIYDGFHASFWVDDVNVGDKTVSLGTGTLPYIYVGVASDGSSRKWGGIINNLNVYTYLTNVTPDLVWTTTDTTQVWTLKVDSGKAWSVDWGDGNIDNFVGTGANQSANHNYAGAGTYTIKQYFDSPTDVIIYSGSGNVITGDIAQLASFTSLVSLVLNFTSVSGDVSVLSPLTSLVVTRFFSTSVSYTTASLPPWASNAIQLQNCAWTQAEVDQFLIDLADGVGASGSLNIAGTNAARSSASDAAKAALLAASWTLTVNE